VNLFDVIEELVSERGLARETLENIVCEGMLAAFERKYPDLSLKAEYDTVTGGVNILAEKTVVPSVKDPETEISVKKAHTFDKNAKSGDVIWAPFEGKIGRIEILRARQVIANQIRRIEASAVYEEFKDKLGEVVHGSIHKCERGGAVVKIEDQMAFLPKSNMSPADKCIVGYPIRALLKEVLTEPRQDYQLILDRASEQFLQKLFELEIPEIFEKLVEIKQVVRAPGYKTKMVVASNDPNIDPVGTCVGVGGSRIKPILKELGAEKIDVIPAVESQEALIKQALKPAQIDRIELADNDKVARVWLGEDQRALAIGRMGQNISLASRLTGVDIQLVQNEKPTMEEVAEQEFSIDQEPEDTE
jgi:transcription termination/antitermination protein NusA